MVLRYSFVFAFTGAFMTIAFLVDMSLEFTFVMYTFNLFKFILTGGTLEIKTLMILFLLL